MFTIPLNWRAEHHVPPAEFSMWITPASSVFSVKRACVTLAQMIGWRAYRCSRGNRWDPICGNIAAKFYSRDSTVRPHCKSILTVISFDSLHTCLWCLWTVIELVCKQKQGLLLTIAVGNMEAMAACCGRSWMVSRRRAGYMPSPRDMWLTACNRESKSTVNATSSSPSIMFLVVVHHNWPPAWEENTHYHCCI